MNAATRLALFAAVIALAFGGAFAGGSAIDGDSAAQRAPSAERGTPAEHDPSPGGHR